MKNQLTIKEFVHDITKGNRVVLAQAITLVESQRPEDVELANQLLETLLPQTGKSIRLGITGVPGVGKSTFIEAFGKFLTAHHKKVAVLAIDPSSTKTKGSILGDKTRMEELSKDTNAFIRPTATGSTLGGVAGRTREVVLLCEAAGFDVIIIETVGVGQSETSVRNMVDFFLLLMLAGAGDELQGIKKGIMEMADAVVITKADGNNINQASQAKADYQHALHLLNNDTNWKPKVITASALEKKGIAETWALIEDFMKQSHESGYFTENRKQQNRLWFQESIQQHVRYRLSQSATIAEQMKEAETEIDTNQVLPSKAAQEIIRDFLKA